MEENRKPVPDAEQSYKEIPDSGVAQRELPETEIKIKELPNVGNPENTVMIGGKLIEIKPMKLIYQRNRTAVFYHALELYPLPDILAMTVDPKTRKSPFGDNRDGDKALMDWLVAVTDNEELIRENYDSIDSDTIYRMLAIFRRVNKIDELEEKLKNAKAPGAKD